MCHPARAVCPVLVGAHARRRLICACNSMLCPIHASLGTLTIEGALVLEVLTVQHRHCHHEPLCWCMRRVRDLMPGLIRSPTPALPHAVSCASSVLIVSTSGKTQSYELYLVCTVTSRDFACTLLHHLMVSTLSMDVLSLSLISAQMTPKLLPDFSFCWTRCCDELA